MSREWIGATSLPVVPAKSLFRERREPSRSDDAHLTPSQTHGVLTQAEYMERTGNRVVLNLTGADQMRHVENGDFISHLRSFQGGLEHSSLEGKVSAAYTVLAPRRAIDSRYYRYLFKSSRYIQGLKTTTDQLRDGQSIRYAQFALLSLPEPSLGWQSRVADYLDRETAEIDAFIADQEELIALLEERRVAARAHAITVTLEGSSADLRTTATLRQLATCLDFLRIPKNSAERADMIGDIPYWGANSIQGYVDRALVDGPLVLVGEDGAPFFSAVKPVAFAIDGPIWPNNHVHVLRAGPRVDYRYLAACLNTVDYSLYVKGGTRDKLNQSELMSIVLPLCDRGEQEAIVATLMKDSSNTDAAIADAREAIALSRERRAAIISAAVTGQIDVTEKKRVLV